jgi:hypothetical protein
MRGLRVQYLIPSSMFSNEYKSLIINILTPITTIWHTNCLNKVDSLKDSLKSKGI